ncbi:MAG: hypothetical protein ABIS45_15105, partial [Burkholderiales bacterium]
MNADEGRWIERCVDYQICQKSRGRLRGLFILFWLLEIGVHRRQSLFFISFLIAVISIDAAGQEPYAAQRKAMVDTVAALARETGGETGRPALGARVLAAMGKVPRHRFVPAGQIPHAYANRPLPIGNGQTISQPFIVAL